MASPKIEISEWERAVGRFLLKYDCVQDQYWRPLNGQKEEGESILGWETLAEKEGGVFRKVESGWRAFLTSEGAGLARWVVRHPGARVKRAEVRMTGWATFRNGQIGADLVCGSKRDTIALANEPFLAEQTADRVWGLNRERVVLKLAVDGVGAADQTALAIQFADLETNAGLDHDLDDSQVFRTPLDAPNAENLVLEIEFEKEEEVKLEKMQQMGEGRRAEPLPFPEEEETEDVVSKRILHLQMAEKQQSGKMQVSRVELEGVHCFLLKYDCVRDQYRRPFNLDDGGPTTTVDGWQRMVHSAQGVARLTEKDQEEFAFIGSNAPHGELVWLIEHPGARVARVELLLSGMSTPDGSDDAKIGVDLRCGQNASQRRRPDAIPFNAQRIDVMEMERVGRADFTEVRVNFQRAQGGGNGGKPSQLFRAVFGEAATADDFVIRIEFEQPNANENGEDGTMKPEEELARKVHEKMVKMKEKGRQQGGRAGEPSMLAQIVLILGRLSVEMRKRVVQLIGQLYGMDLEKELRVAGQSSELVDYLLHPAQQLGDGQRAILQQEEEQMMKEKGTGAVETMPLTGAQPSAYPNLAQVQQESPPPRPSPPATREHFDFEKAAELIHKSIVRGAGGGGLMKMFKKKDKSDVDAILQVLTAVNWQTRQLIGQTYKRRFEHEDLMETVRKEVQDGPERELILAILDGPANLDAIHLHKAIAGLGTTESVLIEILSTRNNAQLQAIKTVYGQMFKNQLEADVGGDTSGTFRTLMLSLCAANRDESLVVKQEKAEQDAHSLYAGGERKWGTDDDTFIALLARENLLQLRAISEEYNRLTGHHLDEAIKREFSGDARDGLMAIVRFARNPRRLFADWIHEAIKTNKEGDVIRLLCTHPNVNFNLAAVAAEYQSVHGIGLAQAIYDSKLHTKHQLATIVNRGGVLF